MGVEIKKASVFDISKAKTNGIFVGNRTSSFYMPLFRVLLVFCLCCLSLFTAPVHSQSARLIPVKHPAYRYISQLQTRGFLETLNATKLPYSEQEILNALENVNVEILPSLEKSWIEALRVRLKPGEHELNYGINASGGIQYANTDRLDAMRPIFQGNGALPFIHIRPFIGGEHWVAQGGMRFDRAYNEDPDGLDLVRRLQTRSEEVYVGYQNTWFQVYLGRLDVHWGIKDAGAAFISQNPRSFDALHTKIGNERISISAIMGELDMLGPGGSFSERDRFLEGGKRRFLSLHRIDWSPKPNLQFTIFEGVIYSGTNAGLSLAYLNPLNALVFVSDNDPKNAENNLLVGFGFRTRFGKLTIQSQVVLDDAVFENRSFFKEIDDLEPASGAGFLHLVYAGLFPRLDVQLNLEVVSSLAYRTDQPEGQWSFAQRGLATNFSDYSSLGIEVRMYADELLRGFVLQPGLFYLVQGQGDFRQPLLTEEPNGQTVPFLGIGTPSKTFRLGLKAQYLSEKPFWFETDIGVNVFQDRFFVEGNSDSFPVALFKVGIDFTRLNF